MVLSYFSAIFSHPVAAETVGEGILLCGQQIAVFVFFPYSIKRIFTFNRQILIDHFDLNMKMTTVFRGNLGCSFQSIVQHVHQQRAQILIRNGQFFLGEDRSPEGKIQLLCLCGGILQNRINGVIFRKENGRLIRLFLHHPRQKLVYAFHIIFLAKAVHGGKLMTKFMT